MDGARVSFGYDSQDSAAPVLLLSHSSAIALLSSVCHSPTPTLVLLLYPTFLYSLFSSRFALPFCRSLASCPPLVLLLCPTRAKLPLRSIRKLRIRNLRVSESRFLGQTAMGPGLQPAQIKNLLESNPLPSRCLVRGLAALPSCARSAQFPDLPLPDTCLSQCLFYV